MPVRQESGPSSRGHTAQPHTADAVIEAWGDTAAACYEEAVQALAGLFVDIAKLGGQGPSHVFFEIGPDRPDRLLVRLLEESIACVDTQGLVPVGARVEATERGLQGSFAVMPVDALEQIGPLPKGVSYHGLVFERTATGWRCTATVDV